MELGKSAKHMGRQHPRVHRKTDPVPGRVTPAVRPPREKPYGFSIQYCGAFRLWGCKESHSWFKTAKARDQAMADFARKHGGHEWVRLIGPVDRL